MRAIGAARFALLLTVAVACGGQRHDVSAAQAASPRAALVIANAAYADDDVPLPAVLADARALSEALKRDGYTVEIAENASKDAMRDAIDHFLQKTGVGGTGFVYFSGYGLQAKGRNYLIPVDARIWNEADVLRDGTAVDRILDELAKRGTKTRAIVLDASRRNPYERRFRSFDEGLAPSETQPGTFILYSTVAGRITQDTKVPRSPFVEELIQQLAASDRTVEQAFAMTREAVMKQHENAPAPALYPTAR